MKPTETASGITHLRVMETDFNGDGYTDVEYLACNASIEDSAGTFDLKAVTCKNCLRVIAGRAKYQLTKTRRVLEDKVPEVVHGKA